MSSFSAFPCISLSTKLLFHIPVLRAFFHIAVPTPHLLHPNNGILSSVDERFHAIELGRENVEVRLKLQFPCIRDPCWFCEHPRGSWHTNPTEIACEIASTLDYITAYLVPTEQLTTISPMPSSTWFDTICAHKDGHRLLTQIRHMQHCNGVRDSFCYRAPCDVGHNHFNLCDVVIPILERRLLSMLPGCSITDAITELYPGSSLADRDDRAA